MPTFSHIQFETSGSVARIVLNRPEKRNALSSTMIGEISGAIEIAATDKEARVILIRGAGKDFCAGADLAQLEEVSNRSCARQSRRRPRVCDRYSIKFGLFASV